MFPAQSFARLDEQADEWFYVQPRLVVHLDAQALRCTTDLYRAYLPAHGAILDLMSSWRSHLPLDVPFRRVVGLGMNALELAENPQLTEFRVQNLNRLPQLPYESASFDGCTLCVSVQYLTQPVAVFAEVARVLRPGAPFITVFSNRMFPSKAVAIWQMLNDVGRTQLVSTYYELAGGFAAVEVINASGRVGDPLYAVIGWKEAGG